MPEISILGYVSMISMLHLRPKTYAYIYVHMYALAMLGV